ncbi:histone H1-like [Melospiza georgiana]|uniref:histone H1-like n=1 Tax=Melospiza georgiana TaxID=44398 RepID=UPI0025AC0EA9|nr:histone H1-like [Melospiza georgiana]
MKASTMLDTALTAPRARAAPGKPKMAASGSKAHKAAGPSVTKLLTRAVSAPKERKELPLATLRKALPAGGHGEEKNKSHIKLGPKSLTSNGTRVQTKGIGASGSFKLNKKPGETKEKATKEKTAAKRKKSAAKKPAGPAKKHKKVVIVKKRTKKAKKPAATEAKKAAKSLKGGTQAGHAKEVAKSPAKVKVVKAKAAKPKAVKPKVAKAKKTVPKKK